ncbi:MAG: hypothetical protein V4481_02980 [Patescibacteria group bacterium]
MLTNITYSAMRQSRVYFTNPTLPWLVLEVNRFTISAEGHLKIQLIILPEHLPIYLKGKNLPDRRKILTLEMAENEQPVKEGHFLHFRDKRSGISVRLQLPSSQETC